MVTPASWWFYNLLVLDLFAFQRSLEPAIFHYMYKHNWKSQATGYQTEIKLSRHFFHLQVHRKVFNGVATFSIYRVLGYSTSSFSNLIYSTSDPSTRDSFASHLVCRSPKLSCSIVLTVLLLCFLLSFHFCCLGFPQFSVLYSQLSRVMWFPVLYSLSHIIRKTRKI